MEQYWLSISWLHTNCGLSWIFLLPQSLSYLGALTGLHLEEYCSMTHNKRHMKSLQMRDKEYMALLVRWCHWYCPRSHATQGVQTFYYIYLVCIFYCDHFSTFIDYNVFDFYLYPFTSISIGHYFPLTCYPMILIW